MNVRQLPAEICDRIITEADPTLGDLYRWSFQTGAIRAPHDSFTRAARLHKNWVRYSPNAFIEQKHKSLEPAGESAALNFDQSYQTLTLDERRDFLRAWSRVTVDICGQNYFSGPESEKDLESTRNKIYPRLSRLKDHIVRLEQRTPTPASFVHPVLERRAPIPSSSLFPGFDFYHLITASTLFPKTFWEVLELWIGHISSQAADSFRRIIFREKAFLFHFFDFVIHFSRTNFDPMIHVERISENLVEPSRFGLEIDFKDIQSPPFYDLSAAFCLYPLATKEIRSDHKILRLLISKYTNDLEFFVPHFCGNTANSAETSMMLDLASGRRTYRSMTEEMKTKKWVAQLALMGDGKQLVDIPLSMLKQNFFDLLAISHSYSPESFVEIVASHMGRSEDSALAAAKYFSITGELSEFEASHVNYTYPWDERVNFFSRLPLDQFSDDFFVQLISWNFACYGELEPHIRKRPGLWLLKKAATVLEGEEYSHLNPDEKSKPFKSVWSALTKDEAVHTVARLP